MVKSLGFEHVPSPRHIIEAMAVGGIRATGTFGQVSLNAAAFLGKLGNIVDGVDDGSNVNFVAGLKAGHVDSEIGVATSAVEAVAEDIDVALDLLEHKPVRQFTNDDWDVIEAGQKAQAYQHLHLKRAGELIVDDAYRRPDRRERVEAVRGHMPGYLPLSIMVEPTVERLHGIDPPLRPLYANPQTVGTLHQAAVYTFAESQRRTTIPLMSRTA